MGASSFGGARNGQSTPQYRRVPVRPINAGLNSSQNPVLIGDGESPDALNVDFNRGSVAFAKGSSKFNNQTAPRPGLLVGVRSNGATLPVLPGKSVPIIGSAFLGYSESQDVVGADYLADTLSGGTAPDNRCFVRQRGKSFDIQASFRLPESEKLYAAPTLGVLTNTTTATAAGLNMRMGFDQALDEFFAVIQKGGDRLTPMSWALGVVNTGSLFDTVMDGSGNNIFGLNPSVHATRVSNYALCFMWLDLPCVGAARPMNARYKLTNGGTVTFDPTEVANLTTATGAYATFAYRAMIVPFFIEPGVDYHTALRLTLDTGSPGSGFVAATGTLTGPAWSANGVIDWRVARGYDAPVNFSSTNGAGTEVLRYKGPADSLEYLCKYGVRYHGRDAMHLGLGFRYSAWTSAGFLPFGIDSAPSEVGGFQMTDQSVHGYAPSLYGEYDAPEEEPSVSNVKPATANYTLSLEHLVAAAGLAIGVSEVGMASKAFVGHRWGNETLKWASVSPQGKNPWAPYDKPWAGLGALPPNPTVVAFNSEALRSYRVVFAPDTAGFAAAGACGGLISINQFFGTKFGAFASNQYFTPEGGLTPFVGGNPNLVLAAGNYTFYVRAFRWNQRPVVVSDVRLYSTPRIWDARANFSLTHELDPALTGDPGLPNLRAHWPLTDGTGTELRETVLSNSGFMSPMAGTRPADGGLFLSGEGEALYVNLGDNPDFRSQLLASQADPKNGVAIQITMRLPEACYSMPQRVNNEAGVGGASSYYRAKFAPILATWDFEVPDRASDLLAEQGTVFLTNALDHVGGNLTRPQPLLEFGHNVYIENAVGLEPFAYPTGFSLRLPDAKATVLATDSKDSTISVPGTGATGLHAWFLSGTNQSRWDKFAGWAGRDIVVQFGLEPTSTAEVFRPYIAAWPKEFLNPAANDAGGSEFAYFASSVTVTRRQLERSVIVIGGGWNPKDTDFRSGGQWLARGRSAHELNARMIVRDVRVFAASPAGALPATTGAAVAEGTGKIVGENALPLTPLNADDLVYPIASGGVSVNMTEDSRSVVSTGSSAFSSATPESSSLGVVRTFLAVLGDKLVVPVANTDSQQYQRTYWISGVTASTLTLARPVVGPTRKATGAVAFRCAAYTAFQDDISPLLTVGKGRGYDLSSSTTKDAQISEQAFVNPSPVGAPWRFRVYSSIPSGQTLALLPAWVRAATRSTWNRIRGLHGFHDTLYVGAQGSLFEADDRWRVEGPSDELPTSMDFRAKLQGTIALPLQDDRVVFSDTSLLQLSTWAVATPTAYIAFLDCWLRPRSVSGLRTIAWCGRLTSNPANTVSAAATAHGLQFWTRLSDGYPELVIGATSNDATAGVPPARGFFIARGTRRIDADEWTHVRWALQGVDAASDTLGLPVLWIGGKRVSTVRNATGAGAGSDWLLTSAIPWTSSYSLVLGAARDAVPVPIVDETFLAVQNAKAAPIPPKLVHGFAHAFDGELCAIVMGRATGAATDFSLTADFNPFAIDYDQAAVTRRFAAMESEPESYGLGHKLLDTALPQWGTIYSHPFISITHRMGSEDAQWSFANFEDDIFCANGGRVGVINSETNGFRFAGIEAPRTVPQVEIQRTPLWQPNAFVRAPGSADNGPILDNNATAIATTYATATATVSTAKQNFHFNNPGTMVLRQAAPTGLTWIQDTFIVFKCYLRLDSVSGRINIFSKRSSSTNGTVFLEVRDGYLYFGWYDVGLKAEAWVRTSLPVIEPGYVYYIYARKFYPRGGLLSSHNAFYTRLGTPGTNWHNSVHSYVDTSNTARQAHDALIWRRFARTTQSSAAGVAASYTDWTGYDAKAYVTATDVTAGWGGQNPYDYTRGPGGAIGNSSARACVSATAADSEFLSDPYAKGLTITGCVMYDQALNNTGNTGDASGRVQLRASSVHRFLLDHVGMLLQVHRAGGGGLDGQIFRIVEFISGTTVRCVSSTGAAAAFNGLVAATDSISVGIGVSLVKSENYDRAITPDPGDYNVEMFGSSLQSNRLNGFTPFQGETWGAAYTVCAGTAVGSGNHFVGLPPIFENLTAANCPGAAAGVALGAAAVFASACEAGTDVFGLQGTTAPLTGLLPCSGIPAGELMVDAGAANVHTSFDTYSYLTGLGATKLTPYVPNAIAPLSTQPNSTFAVAQDSGANSAPVWVQLSPVLTGVRYARTLFYDRSRDTLSAPGRSFTLNIPVEDVNNPSAAVKLVFRLLPACPDGPGYSTRVYLSAANSTVPLLRAQVDDDSPDSIGIIVDQVNESIFEVLDITALGLPPNAAFVCNSQSRLCYGRLEGQADGFAASLPYYPDIVPLGNIYPVNGGNSSITALADFKNALVVFKRDLVLPLQFDADTGEPRRAGASAAGDGCVSAASIARLEDRLYYVSDRGPQVLLEGWQPFFMSKRTQEYFADEVDKKSYGYIQGAFNRTRNQYVITLKEVGRSRMDRRLGFEFEHALGGANFERVEMPGGHSAGRYDGFACTALGTVQRSTGGPMQLVGGTDQGFVVWMDVASHQMALSGPLLLAGSTPLWGSRTLTVGASSITGTFDRTLEGPMGQALRGYNAGEKEAYVLFSTNDGLDRLYLLDPLTEARAWATANGLATGSTLSLGAQLNRWSTKAFDAGTIDLEKLFYYLDMARKPSTGTVKVDCFRNGEATPKGTLDMNLLRDYEALPVFTIVQQARVARFLVRTQTPAVDVDCEILDVVVRLGDHDPR